MKVKALLDSMTLREKIGQTVVFDLRKLGMIENYDEYFTQNPIGCAWTLGHTKERYIHIETALGNPELNGRKDEMYINFINIVNRCVKIPVIHAIDAASGINKHKFEDHADMPTATGLGATRDPELAFRYGKTLGDDLHSIGLRWIWSPVADNAGVFTDARCMSSDYENNSRLMSAFIKGMQSAGVATGAKHFPGSDPYDRRDSHYALRGYSQSFETWEKTQMREFQACIDAGVDSVMMAHTTFRAVDDTRVNGALISSSMSYKVVTELLKGKMGFQGVVITDGVQMKALTAIYSPEELYVGALRAGIDVVLGPGRLDYIDIVEAAVLSGDLPESRIDDACERVLRLKEKYNLLEHHEVMHPTEERREEVKKAIHELNCDIAAKGLTLVSNRTDFLPVRKETIRKVKIAYIGYREECYENLRYMVEEFERHGARCDVQNGFYPEDNATLDQYDLILYATYIGFHAPRGASTFVQEEAGMMWNVMTKCKEKSMAVSFGNTDIFFNHFSTASTFVNCYSYNQETMEGLVKGIYGELQFIEYNPFPLNPITRSDEVFV